MYNTFDPLLYINELTRLHSIFKSNVILFFPPCLSDFFGKHFFDLIIVLVTWMIMG